MTVPYSSAHCKARNHRSKSMMKPTSQGQVRLVGLCRETIGVAEGRGSGPISCWHGHALAESMRTFGKSLGLL